MLLASLIIWRPVFFSRYLFVMTGLYIFWIAYLMSLEKNKIVIMSICTMIMLVSTMTNIMNINLFYDKGNVEVYDYIRNDLQKNDIFIYSDVGPRWSNVCCVS